MAFASRKKNVREMDAYSRRKEFPVLFIKFPVPPNEFPVRLRREFDKFVRNFSAFQGDDKPIHPDSRENSL